jgi:hypothetical protein
MVRTILVVWVFGLAAALPVFAQEAAVPSGTTLPPSPGVAAESVTGPAPAAPAPCSPSEEPCPAGPDWETVWGVVGVRVFFAGPKEAPNGEEYHPHSSLDLDFNYWVWRSQGLYLFADLRFWNEKSEYGVTNGKDSSLLGFSKRQLDLVGGPAWNYAGPWEARLFGYTYNNLNRGTDLVKPTGLNDGFGMENRYYLSDEYKKLGQRGYDVARADFVSVGYYLTKDLVGNDGKPFTPGLMLRTYLTHDLWDWPVYAYGDVTYIGERSFQAKLLLFDLGLAARPFRDCELMSAWRNWEVRFGAENTADFQTHSVQNLWYATIRVIF